jgi:hypothetical protein
VYATVPASKKRSFNKRNLKIIRILGLSDKGYSYVEGLLKDFSKLIHILILPKVTTQKPMPKNVASLH